MKIDNPKSVLVVMVCRNGLSMTRDALASVLALNYPETHFSIYVIDNASSDGTAAWLHTQATQNDARYSTVYFRDPRSVAACWNYALEWAFAPTKYPDYDAVLVLNSDIILRADTLYWLTKAALPFVTCVGVRDPKMLGKPVYDGTGPLDGKRDNPDFSSFLISKEVWRKVGRFNEDYLVAYGEDAEYHVRMHFAGIKAYCLSLPFIHYGSGTITNSDPAEKRRIQRAADANRARFADEYGCAIGSKEYYAIFES